ncbi:MAG: alpha/beta hydrolase [Candidatus Aminicenantes bacterium]|nr:MAG: alpha/beta hydrolase [Candidatus Aminicenantes bacterium]
MKMDAKTIEKYFGGISETELQRFQGFLDTHPLMHAEFKGNDVPYYRCGKGEKTILAFSGGHSGPWALYNSMIGLEDEFQIVVVDFSSLDNLDDFCRSVNHVLEEERIEKVCVTGQSLTGMFAQAYFRRNVGRVEAMVLTNTLAPKKERNKKAALTILRFFPAFLLKPLINKRLAQVGKIDAKISPEVQERLAFRMALLRHDIDQVASKKTLLAVVRMLFEFNEKDSVPVEGVENWPGKVLVVTSEDEPYRADVELLMALYPDAELFSFPAGWRHAAPLILMERFQILIKDFLLEDRCLSSKNRRE